MPPRRRGRPSLAQKSSASSSVKEGISVGLVTDEEEEENALGGATLEFVPLALNDEAPIENVGNQGKIILEIKKELIHEIKYFIRMIISCIGN